MVLFHFHQKLQLVSYNKFLPQWALVLLYELFNLQEMTEGSFQTNVLSIPTQDELVCCTQSQVWFKI